MDTEQVYWLSLLRLSECDFTAMALSSIKGTRAVALAFNSKNSGEPKKRGDNYVGIIPDSHHVHNYKVVVQRYFLYYNYYIISFHFQSQCTTLSPDHSLLLIPTNHVYLVCGPSSITVLCYSCIVLTSHCIHKCDTPSLIKDCK